MEKTQRKIIPEKGEFYGYLSMEDVNDADYVYAKGVCKHFEIKFLGEHHDLYAQSNKLLLADVFENFQNMCI